VTVGNAIAYVQQLLICAKWHNSHQKKKFSAVTGWQNLTFLWLFNKVFSELQLCCTKQTHN
jgi:hypothetical protein